MDTVIGFCKPEIQADPEPLWNDISAGPAAHHNGHNNVSFQIKKIPYGAKFLLIIANPLVMFDAHFEKHEAKGAEYGK